MAVLTISVIAVFAGAQNFREIGDEAADLPPQILARVKARWCLRRLRWVAPSAATIRRVIGDVDADLLDEVIYQWLRTRTGWDTRDNQQEWLLSIEVNDDVGHHALHDWRIGEEGARPSVDVETGLSERA